MIHTSMSQFSDSLVTCIPFSLVVTASLLECLNDLLEHLNMNVMNVMNVMNAIVMNVVVMVDWNILGMSDGVSDVNDLLGDLSNGLSQDNNLLLDDSSSWLWSDDVLSSQNGDLFLNDFDLFDVFVDLLGQMSNESNFGMSQWSWHNWNVWPSDVDNNSSDVNDLCMDLFNDLSQDNNLLVDDWSLWLRSDMILVDKLVDGLFDDNNLLIKLMDGLLEDLDNFSD